MYETKSFCRTTVHVHREFRNGIHVLTVVYMTALGIAGVWMLLENQNTIFSCGKYGAESLGIDWIRWLLTTCRVHSEFIH